MNNKKYDGVYYPVRDVTDLKDIIIQSTDLFPDETAYLEKDRTIGEFVPITYARVREEMDAFGTKLVDMMGYYNAPDATDEVIVDGWFHTGDLGYVDSNRFIYITGRQKNVIITKNGKNVYPEELENYLARIPFIAESMDKDEIKDYTRGKLIAEMFEEYCEDVPGYLDGPVFVIGHPVEVSPLAKRDPEDPRITRRFEAYINGWEIANAFSELNDPIDQYERFAEQQAELDAGIDDEAHPMDLDFVNALEVGLPPTGGLGVGIDRVIMITHNEEIAQTADRILHIEDGRLTGGDPACHSQFFSKALYPL